MKIIIGECLFKRNILMWWFLRKHDKMATIDCNNYWFILLQIFVTGIWHKACGQICRGTVNWIYSAMMNWWVVTSRCVSFTSHVAATSSKTSRWNLYIDIILIFDVHSVCSWYFVWLNPLILFFLWVTLKPRHRSFQVNSGLYCVGVSIFQVYWLIFCLFS